MQNLDKTDISSTTSDRGPACRSCAWWRLPLLLAAVLAAIVLVNRSGIRHEESTTSGGPSAVPAPAATSGQTVSLAIDCGNDRRREWGALPWHEGMTVADALKAAVAQPAEEKIEFAQQGSGAGALLTRLGESTNEGAGGRNWTYDVNGDRGDRSFAIYELQPGDQVLWKFAAPK